jgi:predicted TIM-barrel fold metal-dependent hydrolase
MSSIIETEGLSNTEEVISRIDDYTVVDVDVHEITVDTGRFAKYVEEPYTRRVEKLGRSDEPLASSLVGTFDFDLDPTPHGLEEDVKTTTPEGLTAFRERFNTDYLLIHGHQLEAVANIPEAEYAHALCQAHNEMLLDKFLPEDEGFKGSILVAPQAPKLAAEEIHRLADEDDLVNVHVSASPNGLLGDPKYHPIYEAAEKEGMAITYHPGFPNIPWSGMYGGPFLESTAQEVAVLGHHMLTHVPSLIFQGVPEKFPDLEHVFLEQGITWIPWMMGRMDLTYERRGHELEWLDRKPSEYLTDHFYFGTQPLEEPAGVGNMLKIFEMIDAKNTLMYSTDFPHFDFDFPSVLTIPEMDEETERAIFGENAIRVLDI